MQVIVPIMIAPNPKNLDWSGKFMEIFDYIQLSTWS